MFQKCTVSKLHFHWFHSFKLTAGIKTVDPLALQQAPHFSRRSQCVTLPCSVGHIFLSMKWGFPARHGAYPKWLAYFMEHPIVRNG